MKQVIDAKVGKEKKISPEARFLVFLRASKSLWDVHTIEELTKCNFEKTGKVMTMNPILTSKCNNYSFL